MNFDNLLIEIGTEELPPKALRTLAESFVNNFCEELDKAELSYSKAHWYAAPRRLALYVEQLALAQQDKVVEKRGPAVSSAFDAEGKPTKAAEGWARGNGISVAEAERLVTDKGEWLLHRAKVEGVTTESLIPAMAQRALDKLPIPKPMRWGSNKTQFIRPVHTVTMLLGDKLVAGELLGITSARTFVVTALWAKQLRAGSCRQLPQQLERARQGDCRLSGQNGYHQDRRRKSRCRVGWPCRYRRRTA